MNDTIADATFSILPSLREAFATMGRQIIDLAPKVVVSLIIIFVGWAFAVFISRVLTSFFKRSGADKLFQSTSLAQSLHSAGIRIVPGVVLAKASFWILLLFTIKTAADSAGLKDISAIVLAVFRFLPKAAIATIILGVGFFVADLLRQATTGALLRVGLNYAKTAGSLVFGFVLVIVLTVALAQLGIQADLLISSVQILLGAIALALALALGLGLRDAAAALVAGIYAKDVFRNGALVELEGEVYEVKGIGPLTAKLHHPDGSILIVPNTQLTQKIHRAHPGDSEPSREGSRVKSPFDGFQ
ncbi:MAG: mechanosensitive ion channel [Luteolibacter sp.]